MSGERRSLLAVVGALAWAALGAGTAFAQTSSSFALVHAKLYTMDAAQPLENATVVVRDGKVQAVGAGLAPPVGVRVVDVQGRIVTPGLMSAGTQLGLTEVGSLPDTRDYALASGTLGAAFDVQYALNANTTAVDLAVSDGLTRALTHPEGSAVAPFLGQAALLRLTPGVSPLDRAQVAMFVRVGSGAAAATGGSHGAPWILLRNALDEARRFKPTPGVSGPRDQLLGRLDAEALQPVVAGRMPLAIVADRESDVRQAIALHDDTKLPVLVYGGAEAWRVAKELAARRIPVVLDPTLNLPLAFDTMGARLDNAARLQRAGVPIAFSVSAFHRTYNAGNGMRLGAGLAVANGLPWIEGLRAMTTAPAAMFGLGDRYGKVRSGYEADLVVWDGDPLEPSSAALQVWVRGVEVVLENARHR
ncbi:MAG TPA: amidohydrolase family protein, partial [Steroidobacteraceae bacterium]|nr:amidohydrolase family protein [Steroidobacteraceae bacterium]